jgi:phosphatidylinositol 4-phosphatase
MDNLDRTNVVQAALAKWTLHQQLKAIGVVSDNEELDDFDALTRGFRESKAVAAISSLHTHYAI